VEETEASLGNGGDSFTRQRVRDGRASHLLRVVVTGTASLSPRAALWNHRFSPIHVWVAPSAPANRVARLRSLADEVWTSPASPLDLQAGLEHLAAAQRIVPQIEGMQGKGLVTMSLVNAGRYYAVLAFMADGPSVGIGRYGDFQAGQPAWDRNGTTDERLRARAMFEKARAAAFAIRDRSNVWVVDEQLRHAVEPVILGDAAAWAPGQIGQWLSGYTSRNGINAAGVTEIVAVLRRLRLFFGIDE
jgi:hypothetical protein